MTDAAVPSPRAGPPGIARLIPDDRLARRAAAGDQRALAEIYRRYQQDLYRFCVAMLGNPEDAQDALQNTMLKVVRALPGEKREIKLKPWLYRIARNEAVETLRRRRDTVELEPDRTAAVGELAETAEDRARLRVLIADLEELPERQRAALVLRELSGLGFAEIGTAFDSSASVARQTLYEARRSLRQMEAGREMSCEAVMRELSDDDGRVSRRRELRAHLRDCADCRAFRDAIASRRGDMAAIAPLPAAASVALLNGVLGGGAGTAASAATGAGAGGGLGGAIGAATGKAVATSAIVKSAATVAVVATVGVSAADRGGLIEVPLGSGGGNHRAAPEIAPGGLPAGAAGSEDRADGTRDGDAAGVEKTDGSAAGKAADRSRGDKAKGKAGRDRHRPAGERRKRARGRGHARSNGGKRGRGKPAAPSHGQRTAGSRKPPQANPSPGTPRSGPAAKPPPKPSPPSNPAKEKTAPPAKSEPKAKSAPAERLPPAERRAPSAPRTQGKAAGKVKP